MSTTIKGERKNSARALPLRTRSPQLLGISHVDETAIKCSGVQKWFWEMIDEQIRFLVAGHLSGSRTTEEALAVFEKSLKVAKRKKMKLKS